MWVRAFIAGAALPATTDYDALELAIQRELDALGEDYQLPCECAEIAIEILDEIGCCDVFLGNINLVCPLAYRYGQILCDKHRWAAESDYLNFHEVLTSIIARLLKEFSQGERMLLTGALLEEMQPWCGHWRGYREKLATVVGRNTAEEIITAARTGLIAELGRLEKEGCVIEEGEESFENIPKAGPHFE